MFFVVLCKQMSARKDTREGKGVRNQGNENMMYKSREQRREQERDASKVMNVTQTCEICPLFPLMKHGNRWDILVT